MRFLPFWKGMDNGFQILKFKKADRVIEFWFRRQCFGFPVQMLRHGVSGSRFLKCWMGLPKHCLLTAIILFVGYEIFYVRKRKSCIHYFSKRYKSWNSKNIIMAILYRMTSYTWPWSKCCSFLVHRRSLKLAVLSTYQVHFPHSEKYSINSISTWFLILIVILTNKVHWGTYI